MRLLGLTDKASITPVMILDTDIVKELAGSGVHIVRRISPLWTRTLVLTVNSDSPSEKV